MTKKTRAQLLADRKELNKAIEEATDAEIPRIRQLVRDLLKEEEYEGTFAELEELTKSERMEVGKKRQDGGEKAIKDIVKEYQITNAMVGRCWLEYKEKNDLK